MSTKVTIREFAVNTRTTRHKDGSVTIRCRKGLWSVTGPRIVDVSKEALHYYRQYASDGEYDDD